MRFVVVSIFPELFVPFLDKGLVGKAQQAGRIQVECVTPRDFVHDRHRSVDDAPYGGGSGMVMMPAPLLDAVAASEGKHGRLHRVMLTPQGRPFDQRAARRLSTLAGLLLVCGRYEGVDERVREAMDEEISLGDFVMTGGEIGAMAVIDATARLLPGVLGNADSVGDESHAEGLLEYPQYTRPAAIGDRAVPPVLLSGDHAAIARWRRQQSLVRTRARRPDLFAELSLGEEDLALLRAHDEESGG